VRLVLKRFRIKFDIAVTALLINITDVNSKCCNAYLTGYPTASAPEIFYLQIKVFYIQTEAVCVAKHHLTHMTKLHIINL
jgi:hypothetical protein